MMLTVRPSGSVAIPVCCSTVTPGKLATFWRSPVRRLNSVVLPEFGGPITATVFTAAEGLENSRAAAGPQLWQFAQSLIVSFASRQHRAGRTDGARFHAATRSRSH